MKKAILTFLTIAIGMSLNAQIKVNSSGNVGIGANPGSYKLTVTGTTHFQTGLNVTGLAYLQSARATGTITFSPADGDIIFDQYYGDARMRPEYNYSCYLGGPVGGTNYQFYEMRTYRLFVNGVQVTSDERKKENITLCKNAVEKINLLKPVTFDFSNDSAIENIRNIKIKDEIFKSNKNRIGFLAQDMLNAFPELVYHDKECDLYSINYLEIIPLLTAGMQEQQKQIEFLQSVINSQ